jgi:Rieske Fe-S protein
VRTGTSSFAAFSLVCPHQGTTVSITNGSFTCPNHGARFNAAGTWIGGQSTGNLRSYSATFDATAGTITVARPS